MGALAQLRSQQRVILGLIVVAALASGIGSSYPQNTWLQAGPVLILTAFAPWLLARWPLANASLWCVTAFLLIHLFAAHWTYSDVPYDRWLDRVAGVQLADILGSSRNMFDRFVHFAFGALAVRPIIDIETRYAGASRRLAIRLAVLFVLASSALYEIFEWTLAILMSPEAAEAYNGQQGDMFDGQKDMMLAFAGSVVALVALRLGRKVDG